MSMLPNYLILVILGMIVTLPGFIIAAIVSKIISKYRKNKYKDIFGYCLPPILLSFFGIWQYYSCANDINCSGAYYVIPAVVIWIVISALIYAYSTKRSQKYLRILKLVYLISALAIIVVCGLLMDTSFRG